VRGDRFAASSGEAADGYAATGDSPERDTADRKSSDRHAAQRRKQPQGASADGDQTFGEPSDCDDPLGQSTNREDAGCLVSDGNQGFGMSVRFAPSPLGPESNFKEGYTSDPRS
jgi:hypothetical protein